MPSPLFFCLLFFLLLTLLTGCGQKPDGTPYGVNPKKHPHGHVRRGMPKGAELNAISKGGTQGQPNN